MWECGDFDECIDSGDTTNDNECTTSGFCKEKRRIVAMTQRQIWVFIDQMEECESNTKPIYQYICAQWTHQIASVTKEQTTFWDLNDLRGVFQVNGCES